MGIGQVSAGGTAATASSKSRRSGGSGMRRSSARAAMNARSQRGHLVPVHQPRRRPAPLARPGVRSRFWSAREVVGHWRKSLARIEALGLTPVRQHARSSHHRDWRGLREQQVRRGRAIVRQRHVHPTRIGHADEREMLARDRPHGMDDAAAIDGAGLKVGSMKDAGARRLEGEDASDIGGCTRVALQPRGGVNGHRSGLDGALHARRPIPLDGDGPARRAADAGVATGVRKVGAQPEAGHSRPPARLWLEYAAVLSVRA